MKAIETDTKLKAPWTPDQVAALNRFQKSGFVHEFTCGNDHEGDRVLVAHSDGWHCPSCSYVQNWAHRMMLETPKDPFETLGWRRPAADDATQTPD